MTNDPNLEAERAALKLLPCPMCAGRAEVHEMNDYFMAACECGVCYEGPTADDCVRAWNRRASTVGEDGLPPLPVHPSKTKFGHDWSAVEQAAIRQAQREAVAADRRARRPRVTLDPDLKAALDEAAKTRSTAALLPNGEAVFINYGHQPEDTAHLECTACGGSGHIDDQRLVGTQDEQDAKRYRMLRDSEKIPAAVWHALETGIWVDETIDGWIAETSPIPFCDPCKAGRYGECQYAIPCTLPAPIAAPSLPSEQQAENGEK